MKIIGEMKWVKGFVLDQRKTAVNPIDAAFEYVNQPVNEKFTERVFVFPVTTKGQRGRLAKGQTARNNGHLLVAVYSIKQVNDGLRKLAKGQRCAFGIDNNIVKLMRTDLDTVRKTFGEPVITFDTGMTKRADIGEASKALYNSNARQWELVACEAIRNNPDCDGCRHTGDLRSGKGGDLIQSMDCVIDTSIPLDFWTK